MKKNENEGVLQTDALKIDAMAPYRVRIYFWLAIVGMVLFLPFAINNLLQGRTLLGVGNLIFMLLLAINAVSIYRGRTPLIPPLFLFLFSIVSFTLAIRAQGLISIFWCYPAVVLFHFILPRRTANILNVLLIMAATSMSWIYIGPEMTARFFATIVALVVFNNIFSHIVESMQSQLYALTIIDSLTGAYNRRHMDKCLEQAVVRKNRMGHPASIISVDVDHFKQINDKLGHPAGDAVLCGLFNTLTSRLRKTDLVFRAGGDEIVLLLPDTSMTLACRLAAEIRATIEKTALLENCTVTVSMGVAELQHDEGASHWMRRCDAALYRAKEQGRNCYVPATVLSEAA